MPSEKALAVLADLDARLRAGFPEKIKEVILFGSQAKGTAREASDYDFLVVLHGSISTALERELSRTAYGTDLAFGVCTDLHFLTESDMRSARGAQPIFQDAYQSGLRAA